MLAEIITIGDEILIGQIVDTNSAFISKELNKIGVQVYQITSIQDDREHILQALKDAKEHADLVLVTGGLGPTKDDITKHTFCEFLGDSLIEDPGTLQNIKDIFGKYLQRDPLPANLEQAMVPSSAIILRNAHGTAPGMWMEKDETVYVSMPGVPYEMKYLLTNKVLPRVISEFNRPHIYHKTLLTYGMGESNIAERIEQFENKLPDDIKLAYLPSLGRVRLRLSAKGTNQLEMEDRVNEQMYALNEILSDIAVGYEDETTIQERISAILEREGYSLSVAESCTGGAIAREITTIPGASLYFKGSIIPYETQQKVNILGVPAELIEKHSVVSAEVAAAMADRCRSLFNSDIALSTTGIAGPTRGDGQAEVGTVYIGIATPKGNVVEEFNFGKPRERVITKTTNKAFELLLKEISKI
ncbi:MAG: competence/damage-inducible protein A [Bacteroidia bacterium]|nr:competence/damage-inducible protein A [Bacteroidia bacterium]NNF29864.1 competence/damage-inducible protein A [Flavobacteriaceae bacterium]MBT8275345.1 competence/damage-inducible protein A [Bacteroidia bacterium]NNJ82294.1 competence/damage-inducible protein A [Flavobacteriaceae bacterium]NNK54159.1 competence/damage-inducible protein A [Flavobacteriaceae bacterium]